MSRRGDTKPKPGDLQAPVVEGVSVRDASAQSVRVPVAPNAPLMLMKSELHVGALPTPEQLEAYRAIGPEVLEWILRSARAEQEHRHAMEKEQSARATSVIESRRWRVRWGLAAGVLTMLAGLATFVWAVRFHPPMFAVAGLMTAVVAMVLAFARTDAPPSIPQPAPSSKSVEPSAPGADSGSTKRR